MTSGKAKSGKSGPQQRSEAKRASGPTAPPAILADGDTKNVALNAMNSSMKSARFSQVFSQAVAVLMRDAIFGNLPVRELEHVLLPPLLAGQCVVGNAKVSDNGGVVPVAVALWARVSPAVDKRISENFATKVQLKASEWTSGDIVWLVTVAGAPRALTPLVKQLCEKDLKGQEVKMIIRDKAGKRSIQVLNRDKSQTN